MHVCVYVLTCTYVRIWAIHTGRDDYSPYASICYLCADVHSRNYAIHNSIPSLTHAYSVIYDTAYSFIVLTVGIHLASWYLFSDHVSLSFSSSSRVLTCSSLLRAVPRTPRHVTSVTSRDLRHERHVTPTERDVTRRTPDHASHHGWLNVWDQSLQRGCYGSDSHAFEVWSR